MTPTPRPRRPRGEVDPKRITRACAAGKHHQCIGTVYLYPPEPDRRFAPCECPVRNCGHGRKNR